MSAEQKPVSGQHQAYAHQLTLLAQGFMNWPTVNQGQRSLFDLESKRVLEVAEYLRSLPALTETNARLRQTLEEVRAWFLLNGHRDQQMFHRVESALASESRGGGK